MDQKALRGLLESLRTGERTTDEVMTSLETLPYRDLGFANVDTHRAMRQGFAEVIFGLGKTVEHIVGVATELSGAGHDVLVTRVDPEKGAAVVAALPRSTYEPVSRTITLRQGPIEDRGRGTVLVIAAGTSDLPVAEEAVVTAELMGSRVERMYDVGVAGIHRLLHRIDRVRAATVLIVVAGMEGALPSVVGGLVAAPVIAVPTSVGYGASFGGLAALLGMLNSCASPVTVVNIDNGFGAGYVASLINRRRPEER